MKNIKLFLPILLLSLFISCNKDEAGNTNQNQDITDPIEVARLLNENLILPSNAFTVNPDNVETDNSIFVSSASSGRMPLHTGIDLVNTITFDSQNPITAVGMRFGPTGPISFIPITGQDLENGIASFVFSLNPELCEDIAQICHDIKCYEFAQTSSGAISQADLQDIAMVCGACDEPSCLDLLDEEICNSNGLQGAEGNPRFNLTWGGSTDLDLYVTDPTGETISYQITSSSSGGQLDVDCLGSCQGGNAENIFWANGSPSGTYQYYVNYFYGNDATPFTVSISEDDNVISTVTGSLSEDGQDSQTWTYTK